MKNNTRETFQLIYYFRCDFNEILHSFLIINSAEATDFPEELRELNQAYVAVFNIIVLYENEMCYFN